MTNPTPHGQVPEATQQAPQQEAQQPCPTCAALARTVMMDQVSFDRKPDCYGIRQITDDEGVEEWEDIRTSPDVAREEANDMMATGRGEIYEVVPLWTTPQPVPATQQAGDVSDAMVLAALQVQYPSTYGQYLRHPAAGPKTSIRTEAEIDTARRMIAAALAAAPQPSPTAQAAESVPAAYSGNIEHELAMLIRRIVSSARRNCQDGSNVLKLANEAWTYLVRKGLEGSPLRDAGIESDTTPPAQAAESVLEDAARLDWLDQQCEAYGFQDIHEGNRWEISGPFANVRVAIDAERAARKQGANHD